tara:strand:- start:743 stop:1585 length:843 start_codon:yes stop_codon:yes gene_type:complete
MPKDVLKNLTLDVMIEHIARGHAYHKHVQGEDKAPSMQGINAFTSTYDNNGVSLGADLKIETPLDLKHYINHLIDDPQTIGFVNPRNGSVTLYNTGDNVLMHFNQNDGEHDYGSIYRYHDSRSDYFDMQDAAEGLPFEHSRHLYQTLDNDRSGGSVRRALDTMIVKIQREPEKFTSKPTTHVEHARFISALENHARPGRKDVQGARNNEILHSDDYAATHERNIFGPPSVTTPRVASLAVVNKESAGIFVLAQKLKDNGALDRLESEDYGPDERPSLDMF